MIKIITLITLFSIMTATCAFAEEFTLSWEESPSDSVTGYYVYYQMASDTTPFTGTEADEGDSPIDAGSNLETTLTFTTTGVDYYFAVTAYDDEGNESSYSNIATSAININLLFPEDNTTDEPLTTSFEWDALDSSYDVYYKIVYGTDESEVTDAGLIPAYPPRPIGTGVDLWLLIAGFGILIVRSRKKLRIVARWGVLALFSFSLLNACGGGGGGGSSSTSNALSTTTSDEAILTIVDTGYDDFYDVSLNASTTYYWKVVAVDNSDATVFYESKVYQVSTTDY